MRVIREPISVSRSDSAVLVASTKRLDVRGERALGRAGGARRQPCDSHVELGVERGDALRVELLDGGGLQLQELAEAMQGMVVHG